MDRGASTWEAAQCLAKLTLSTIQAVYPALPAKAAELGAGAQDSVPSIVQRDRPTCFLLCMASANLPLAAVLHPAENVVKQQTWVDFPQH